MSGRSSHVGMQAQSPPPHAMTRLAALVPMDAWVSGRSACDTVKTVLQALWQAPAFKEEIERLTDSAVAGCCCDHAAADDCKRAAMRDFQAGRLENAASLFTRALQLTDECSPEGSAFAARLYANRAQCCLRLHDPVTAESDASNAIAADPRYVKGYFRRARARQAQGLVLAAAEDVQAALLLSAPHSPDFDELKSLLAELQCEEQSGLSGCGGHRSDADEAEGDVGRGRRKEIAEGEDTPGRPASSFEALWDQRVGIMGCLRMETRDGVGRTCVAARKIAAGEDILRDAPFAAVLRRRHRGAHCWACFGTLPRLAPVPASGSADVLYCSRRCRSKDEAVHACELGRPWRTVLPEEVLLGLRAALHCAWGCGEGAGPGRGEVEGMQRLVSHLDALASRARLRDSLVGSWTCSVCAEAGEECVCVAVWRDMVVLGCVAAACVWAGSPDLASVNAGRDPSDLAVSVVTFLARIRCNGFAVVDGGSAAAVGGDAGAWRLAIALFPCASLLNHSCEAPTHVTFGTGGCVLVRATRAIESGEAVSHCYGPQVSWCALCRQPMPCYGRSNCLAMVHDDAIANACP